MNLEPVSRFTFHARDMASQYHIDLTQFSLEKFRRLLETGDLLPSHRPLKEKLAERFAILESMGISNLKELTDTLNTRKKIERFSQESGLPEDYLIMLRRNAGIYTPRPIPLNKFPGIVSEHIQHLANIGIKDTKQLFERAHLQHDRAELSKRANVPEDVLLELVKLSDLTRAPYVGAAWARLLYEAGTDTLEKLATSQPEELCARLRAVNARHKLTKGGLPTAKDMASALEIYKMIPTLIEYA